MIECKEDSTGWISFWDWRGKQAFLDVYFPLFIFFSMTVFLITEWIRFDKENWGVIIAISLIPLLNYVCVLFHFIFLKQNFESFFVFNGIIQKRNQELCREMEMVFSHYGVKFQKEINKEGFTSVFFRTSIIYKSKDENFTLVIIERRPLAVKTFSSKACLRNNFFVFVKQKSKESESLFIKNGIEEKLKSIQTKC